MRLVGASHAPPSQQATTFWENEGQSGIVSSRDQRVSRRMYEYCIQDKEGSKSYLGIEPMNEAIYNNPVQNSI